jgi:predicted AlkP superfamily phosphohydrolase/phosphomutase
MRILSSDMQHRLAAQRFRDRYVWEKTQAFPLPAWTAGLVQINAVGREVAGIVAPAERTEVLRDLATLLYEMTDADSGLPLVDEVIVGPERCPGRRAATLPDLIVTWRGPAPPKRASHPVLGMWSGAPAAGGLFTEHASAAEVLFAGPRVRAGVHDTRPMEDFAPTLLGLAGVKAPSSMPGARWSDITAG